MTKSAYIHIPFCKQKCRYCSFVSFPCVEKIQTYVDALLEEIDNSYKKEELNTLYFGGGTPSLLSVLNIKKIIDRFNLATECEVTLEINPDDANFDYLQSLRNVGINRISFGSQTFDDGILKLIGRRHNSQQIIEAVNVAQKVGFKNISLDLMYGLPNQTLVGLEEDLKIISSLGVQHVSTYGLKIEEESIWGKYPPLNLPNEDMQADMYMCINSFLEQKGFLRYEISNFAQKGFESRHNLNYWNNEEYYGFGVAAHGYVDNIRYSNFITLQEYLKNTVKVENSHIQSGIEKLEEEIFLGFRREKGVNITEINNKYGINFEDKYKKVLDKFTPDYIEKAGTGYKLSLQGVLLSNNILSEFLE